MASIQSIPTKPFDGQRPGTSGLRKRVKVFQQEHYTQNFIQATLEAIPTGAKGATLVVGGDGRYFSQDAVQMIIRIAAGNEVAKLIIGQNTILSTPAASNLIRIREATGGILLTASHNPGGPDNDFGIKYNMSNGGPAPEAVTEKIYEITRKLTSYKEVAVPTVDLSTIGTHHIGDLEIEIVDSVADYVAMLKNIFDFKLIKEFLEDYDFTVLFDGMHGVTGSYGQQIFVNELGLPQSSVMNCVPKPDFGGGHPDPNLTYAHELVERVEKENISFGAASDGDGDRNMIIGKGAFVTPSDSVAIIAAHADAIPYFKNNGGIKGLARSMPTSKALDRVADKKGVEFFEVPTGWKFFGNLMDANRLSICGEESFGTGSDHIREKDGVWAVVAWLNIIASVNPKRADIIASGNQTKPAGIKEILAAHYEEYGRNYFSRYDYEEVDGDRAGEMIERLRKMVSYDELKSIDNSKHGDGYAIVGGDDFEYTDPIDSSVSVKQGVRILFKDGSRLIVRLSGTGSHGATVRLYVEKFDSEVFDKPTQEALKPLIDIAFEITKLKEYTGRDEPTVIT